MWCMCVTPAHSLQEQPEHVRLHVLPPPVFQRKLPSCLGYPAREIVVPSRTPVRRANEEGHDGVDVRVVYLARLWRVSGGLASEPRVASRAAQVTHDVVHPWGEPVRVPFRVDSALHHCAAGEHETVIPRRPSVPIDVEHVCEISTRPSSRVTSLKRHCPGATRLR